MTIEMIAIEGEIVRGEFVERSEVCVEEMD